MTQRTVTARSGALDISALILLAVLLAAGLILNMTLGNALAMTGIKPQFIIAAYALAILLTRGGFAQAAVFGLISAAVIQINTSIPGLNFATEVAGALTMAALVRSDIRIAGRSVTPLVAAFAATLVSGALFAVAGTVLSGFAIEAALVKVPIVAGTAVFNAIVVQALYLPLRAARRQ
ncbi:hypothetical protein H6A33_00050 [Collinsella tanakaei]|uniref:hypothetical protein n=1 Tax=Collinsella TaxID=102106 RepID=UPI00082C1269|nr:MULTISPECIES: hypothetical protein [Collinsella]MBM6777273.1 hypothetical protein [Collinsella tanakaei]MBM6784607.1 hypothetical protein [Collinsella tanakaei]MDN0056465.1 hypothetical protein [Collinsella ihumii]OUO62029.1 hypothetical protein B5F74_02120 [Collinsella sp. An271]